MPSRYHGEACRVLQEAELRLGALLTEIAAFEEQLKSCSLADGAPIIQQRRLALDEGMWLEGRLPELREHAAFEVWQAMKVELNSNWSPLAERRKRATEELVGAFDEFLACIRALQKIHSLQRAKLDDALQMDSLCPGRGETIMAKLMLFQNTCRQDLGWVAGKLAQVLPDTTWVPQVDSLVIDETAVQFREVVL